MDENEKNIEKELDDELMGLGDEEFESLNTDEMNLESTTKDELAQRLSDELETPVQDYKYLKIKIDKISDHEFIFHVEHQSHGFMNYFVSKLINIKGIDFAAYKNTSLEEPHIYIRTDESKEIKSFIKTTLKRMRTEWKGMKNAVAAMDI